MERFCHLLENKLLKIEILVNLKFAIMHLAHLQMPMLLGSTVKMATLLTGYQQGVVRIGETKIDEMMTIRNTANESLYI